MTSLSEQSTVKVLEDNLKAVLKRLKSNPIVSDIKYRKKLLKALSIFYKSINKDFEGTKLIMSKP